MKRNQSNLIRHQMFVRAGIEVTTTAQEVEGFNMYLLDTTSDRMFIVLDGNDHDIKAQIDVIAQLNCIMNNTSIKRA